MKTFFPPLRFLLPLFIAFFAELLHFVNAQNDEFVRFQSFEFPSEPNENSSDSQRFAFAIANNRSTPVNVSLNGEDSSAIVLSAQLCDNSQHGLSSTDLSSNSSLNANANPVLALTVHSDQFKSILLRPDTLPIIDQCPPTNLSTDQPVLLLFEVHSMVNGSRGTLAVRRTDAAEGALAFTAEGVPNELAEENAEWLLAKGKQTLVLPILANCSAAECSDLARVSAQMGIRQGTAEIALVQNCPLSPDGNNSVLALAESRNVLLLDSFPPGEYLRLLDIHFGENGTANATIQWGNHSEESMEIVHCVPTAEHNESSSYGHIHLYVSSSSSLPTLVAFSRLRTFNARPLTTAASESSFSADHFFLLLLLLVASLLLFAFFALLLYRRFFFARQENGDSEQRHNDETHEMGLVGQSERSSRPPSTISKKEASTKISVEEMAHRGVGGGNKGTSGHI